MFLQGWNNRSFLPASLLAGLLVVLLSGCATYSKRFQPIEKSLQDNDPAQALKLLEKQDHSSRNRLLYLCDKAMLLRMLGNYAESNAQFEQAKKLIQEFAAASVTEETSAFIINDATRTYIGTPVEQVMIHLYEALNYLEMGNLNSARVEALQVDVRLRALMQKNPESALHMDPFARYLSGLIYEDLGEWSDSMIAYRKAYEAYQKHNKLYSIQIPDQLKSALVRMADRVGLKDERRKYEQAFGIKLENLITARAGKTEVVFFLHNGLAPKKEERSVGQIVPSSGRLVRISLPSYKRRHIPVTKARLRLSGTSQDDAFSEQSEDIGSLAIKTLEAQMPAITARAIARAVVKYNVSKRAGEQNELAGLITNIVGFAIEQADTRSWLTLPAEIQTARLSVPPGAYTIQVELLDANNRVIHKKQFDNIQLAARHKRYLSFHWSSTSNVLRH